MNYILFSSLFTNFVLPTYTACITRLPVGKPGCYENTHRKQGAKLGEILPEQQWCAGLGVP
jgi:hypothetical protein